MELNGIAHTQLTVSSFEACQRFYGELCAFFEMKEVFKTEDVNYWVGSRTGLAITRCAPEHAGERFRQRRVGLHHLCFRARRREDVDEVHALLLRMGATVVHPPEDGLWAPGYYSVLFEDPDGIRLEVNFVPGKGNFAPGIELPLKMP